MLKILTIIGARPQIIKAAALSRAIRSGFAGRIKEKILHTGQHYDSNMSQVFFDELGIPQPDFNLHVGSGSHGEQTAKMIAGIEKVLQSEPFDALVVYGDTNSTLAGAVAACKLHLPVVHVEAGLRSFNMTMPEEQNRIVCDHLSSLLFAPTETAMENLRHEGFMDSKAVFANGRGRQVYNSGDIMYDNSLYFARIAAEKTTVLKDNALEPDRYVLATIHRDNNTDDPHRLTSIFKALLQISEDCAVALPLHPRTAKLLETNLEKELHEMLLHSNVRIVPPVSFLEMTALEQNARMVLTDSGGVQKEAFFFARPCVIMRPETEWVEIVEQGAGIIADADSDRIIGAYNVFKNKKLNLKPVFGDGNASTIIAEKMLACI
ncbi:MAG: UDP-N-acetylglucosamine 2-epimerase (non-hydrolyzing) [Bacteroidales bacterium]|nr:UDP-N-acetylglucosamine 2-epimerase (non-hydrolyzing) [Bacteroidales bacterium]